MISPQISHRGGKEPKTNTIEVTGDKYEVPDEDYIDTKSSKSVLTAVVTSITAQ